MRSQLKRYADLILDADLNQPVQGILLLAREGRGKRFLGRCLADRLSEERGETFNFISRDLGKANNLYQAGKFIHKWWRECSKHAPAVLLHTIPDFSQLEICTHMMFVIRLEL